MKSVIASVTASLLGFWVLSSPCRAEPAPVEETENAEAAEAFDRGVAEFEHADYGAAARSFLRADELVASVPAVRNAIVAARRAGDHLLVVEAADRGISRARLDPELGTQARDALAEAARSLARLGVSCEPLPCSLELDGEPAEPGWRYVLPGTHVASARVPGGDEVEERLSLIAGATYTVKLHPVRVGQDARPTSIETAPRATAATSAASRDASESTREKPLSPVVVYIGGGLAVALGGLTAWSGIDALAARDDLPNPPTTEQHDSVVRRIRRTDILLGSTLLVAGATGAAALLWVDWQEDVRTGMAVVPSGAILTTRGQF